MNKLQTKTIEEWIAIAKSTFKDYIFYDGYCLDITQFKHLHPGGAQVIKNYLFQDITHILFTVFPHNQRTTPKLLEKYRVGLLSQRLTPRTRMNGTILKKRKEEKENSLVKKSVQFPMEVNKLALEKERIEEMRLSKMKNSKSNMKNSIMGKPNPTDTSQDKKLKRTKKINQDYLEALKGSKGPLQQTKSESQLLVQIDEIKQEPTIKKFDSGELGNVKESTVNVSIKLHLQKSQGSTHEFLDEPIPVIKVPVFNVRLNRIW